MPEAPASPRTPVLMERSHAALVLVDYQARLLPSIHDAERVVQHGVLLGQVARALGVPVFGTEQNPQGLGPNDERIRALCDRTLAKMQFNGAADGLSAALRADSRSIEQVVVAGCEAHVCLLQTTLGLLRDGFRVFVVPDACGSRRTDDKALAMQRLARSGAVLVNGEMVAFEWLRASTDPQFKAVLQLVKQLPV